MTRSPNRSTKPADRKIEDDVKATAAIFGVAAILGISTFAYLATQTHLSNRTAMDGGIGVFVAALVLGIISGILIVMSRGAVHAAQREKPRHIPSDDLGLIDNIQEPTTLDSVMEFLRTSRSIAPERVDKLPPDLTSKYRSSINDV